MAKVTHKSDGEGGYRVLRDGEDIGRVHKRDGYEYPWRAEDAAGHNVKSSWRYGYKLRREAIKALAEHVEKNAAQIAERVANQERLKRERDERAVFQGKLASEFSRRIGCTVDDVSLISPIRDGEVWCVTVKMPVGTVAKAFDIPLPEHMEQQAEASE